MHFSDTYLPRRDGVITSLRTLVTAQRADGHEPMTVVPRHPDQPDEEGMLRLRALPCGVANLRISPWLLRGSAASGSLAAIAGHDAEIVHVHTPGPVGLLGVLAAQRLGLPLVQTYHTDLHAYADAYRFPARALRAGVRLYAHRLDRPRPPMRGERQGPGRLDPDRAGLDGAVMGSTGLGRAGPMRAAPDRPDSRHAAMDAYNYLLLGEAHAVVLPTRAVLERSTLPVPDDRIFVVPTGVAARPTTHAAAVAFRARHGLSDSDLMVLFVGRVNREKGMDLLISAFARVAAAEPAARLVLIGAVYDSRWFAGLLRSVETAVAAKVVLTGEQPADVVAAGYAAANVFAFPSVTDTQALVLQEAALAGLPAVLVDAVLHRLGPLGTAGVLAGASPGAFAAAILGLLRDPSCARRVGAAAASHAAGHTPRRYAQTMYEVYRYATARAGRLNACGRTRR